MFARTNGSNTVKQNQLILPCANCYLSGVTQKFSRTAHNLSGLNYILHNYNYNSVSLVFCNFPLLLVPFGDMRYGRTGGNER